MMIRLKKPVKPLRSTPVCPCRHCLSIQILGQSVRQREIPLSRSRHVRGFFPVPGLDASVGFESLGECRFIEFISAVVGFVSITAQPVTVRYELDGVRRSYTPDFLVEMDFVPGPLAAMGFGVQTLVEVKPSDLVDTDELAARFCAVRKATRLPVALITEVHLDSIREMSHER